MNYPKCPICGRKPSVSTITTKHGTPMFRIECNIPECRSARASHYADFDEAVAVWRGERAGKIWKRVCDR